MSKNKEERTLIIIKPDAIQRNLLGEIIHRFERKGLRLIGMKMTRLGDSILNEHYKHHNGKPFFESLKNYLKSSPVVLLVLSGVNAVSATRLIVGATKGFEADAGTIRGDFSISGQTNIVHASDSVSSANTEIERFFLPDELFEYERADIAYLYGDDER
jgi:nucleoside-diphosphate kinase